MANFAYSNKNRTKLVSAGDELKISNKNYYCLNPWCDATMILKADKSTAVPPYFSAISSSSHVKNCWADKLYNKSKKTSYNPELFNFSTLIDEYMSGNFNKKLKNRLSTIPRIFYMCKTKSINKKYGDTEIWKILADTRSKKIYTKGFFGPHIIECLFHKYDSEKQKIEFFYPTDSPLNPQHKLQIYIPNLELFEETLKRVYNSTNTPIVLVGDWKFSKTTINNKYQIYIP